MASTTLQVRVVMYRRHFIRRKLFRFAILSQVATVLDQLHKFLGPELKAVTGESAGIDEIMDRVEGLALPLNKVISTTRTHELRFGGG